MHDSHTHLTKMKEQTRSLWQGPAGPRGRARNSQSWRTASAPPRLWGRWRPSPPAGLPGALAVGGGPARARAPSFGPSLQDAASPGLPPHCPLSVASRSLTRVTRQL